MDLLLGAALLACLFSLYMMNRKLRGNLIPFLCSKFGIKTRIAYLGKKMVLLPGVHPPSEDTGFFLKSLEGRLHGDVLEIGAGTGITPILYGTEGVAWTCTDIDARAVENARLNLSAHKIKARIIRSDLFESIEGKFDCIIWNFPFILGTASLMRRFIDSSGGYLKEDGRVFLISSALMDLRYPKFREECEDAGFTTIKVAQGSYFLVPITFYELKKSGS